MSPAAEATFPTLPSQNQPLPLPRGRGFLLAALGSSSLFISGWLGMAWLNDAALRFPVFAFCFGLAFAGYVIFVILAHNYFPDRSPGFAPSHAHAYAVGGLFALALAARLAMLSQAPCDDVYRFAWEAKVAAANRDPARLAPQSPELADLRDADYPKLNHPQWASVYPEFAQWAFRLGFSQGLLGWKVLLLIADMLAAWLLMRRGMAAFAAFSLNPLLVFEGVGRGHYEPLCLLSMVLAWRAWEKKKPWMGGLALATSILIKPQGLVLIWPFLIRWRRQPRAWFPILILSGLASAWVVWKVGPNLALFLRDFQYNSWLPWLAAFFFTPSPGASELAWIGPAAVFLTALYLAWKKREAPFEVHALWLIGALLLGTPTFHPWYALWILPFAALRMQWFWLLLTGTQILGLWPYWRETQGHAWHEVEWLRLAMVLPPICISLGLWRHQHRSSRIPGISE